MILKRFAIPALFLAVWATVPALSAFAQRPVYFQERDRDGARGEYKEVQRRGYRDGMEGARRDRDNGRRPDPDNRDEYRHVEPELREAYREAFRRGYREAAAQLWEATPPQAVVPEPPRDWDGWGMRGLSSDAERHGYHEGVEAAREDYRFHRRPDPDDRQEYRYPRVPPEVVEEYREGFMRGYEVAMSQLSGESSWENVDPDRWAPDRFSEVERRGFHDGMEGARRDWDNHRRPNPANRDEYRQPHLPPQLWGEYREGFRRGYEVMMTRLWGR